LLCHEQMNKYHIISYHIISQADEFGPWTSSFLIAVTPRHQHYH